MLPGGMMPVTQLITLVRSSPARSAVGLLTAMPADRLPIVIAEMRPADVARLLPATSPEFRDTLITALSADQLLELVRTASADQAVVLLSTLPDERLSSVVDALPDQAVSVLLGMLPADRRTALLAVTDPRRAHAVLSLKYEHDVARALARTNADVTVPDGAPGGILLVRTLGWRVAVAARYGDDGTIAVREAEDAAYWLRASAALSVTSHPPTPDVIRYCRECQRHGRSIDAVAWADVWQDSPLKRTLVGLFH